MRELFKDVCKIKHYVLQLNGDKLRVFKKSFYQKNIAKWQLDLVWEFFWDDRTYEEMQFILQNKKII